MHTQPPLSSSPLPWRHSLRAKASCFWQTDCRHSLAQGSLSISYRHGASVVVLMSSLAHFKRPGGHQNYNLSSHLLRCVTEFCSVLTKQVEAAVDALNLFLQNTAQFCHTAKQMGQQITVLVTYILRQQLSALQQFYWYQLLCHTLLSCRETPLS